MWLMNVFGDIMFFISEVTFFQTSRCIFVQPLHHENLVVWCAAASPRALLHYESLSYYGYAGSEHNVNMQKVYTEQINWKKKLGGKSVKQPTNYAGFLHRTWAFCWVGRVCLGIHWENLLWRNWCGAISEKHEHANLLHQCTTNVVRETLCFPDCFQHSIILTCSNTKGSNFR